MRRLLMLCLAMSFGGMVCAQVPAGTHSVDDSSADDAINHQIRAAESDLEKQDYKDAEDKLKDLASRRPHDAHVLYDLGFAQESNGGEEDAAKSYAASSAADASFIEPRVALGFLDARAGRTEAAHKELQEAALIASAAPQLRGRALRALARLDEQAAPDQAREELLNAVQLTGETAADISLSAALADRLGDSADAAAAYRRSLALRPGDLDATAGLAHALRQQGKNADAEALLTDALKEHSDDPRLVSQLAAIYVDEGKAKQAIPLLEQMRAANPKLAADPAMTRLLAQVYAVDGDNADAEKLYASLVGASPNDPELLDALGGLQVKLMHYAEAQATLTRAVALRGRFSNPAAWGEAAGHLAFAASKNGHPEVTLQALAARATVLPNSPASLFLEATAHDTLHQYREAERAYQAFLALANGTMPDEEFEARHRLVAIKSLR